jgi:hypothetical protein
MTLPDFLEFEPFNRLRRLMNATLPSGFSSGVPTKHLTHNDLDKALEGIEGLTVDDISDIKDVSDGTLAYKDRRVLCISVIDGPLVDTIRSTTYQSFISRIAKLSKK